MARLGVRLLFGAFMVACVLLLGPSPAAHAHGASPAASQADRQAHEDARTEAAELTEELRGAPALASSKGPVIHAAVANKAQRRQSLINRLAHTSPSAVLDLALTAHERSRLPSSTQQYVEQRIDLDGEFRVFHVDYEDGQGEYVTKLAKNGQETLLAIGAGIGSAKPGDQVRFSGVALAGESTVVTDQMVVQSPSPVNTTGPQRTAIILVMGSGVSSHPYSNKANTASAFFSSANPGSARNFYVEASYGQTVIVGGNGAEGTAADVYGPYSISASTCDITAIRSQAFAAADTALNFSSYDRVVISVITTPAAGCGNGGVGTVRSQFQGIYDGSWQFLSVSWNFNNALGSTDFNGKIGGVALHEYGHNLGVWHANSLDCGAGAIDSSVCYSTEYGDPSDVMGSSSGYGHPNGVHKDMLVWMGSNRAQTISTSGTYQLNAYEEGSDNTKILRIPRTRNSAGAVTGFYYLEYRKPSSTWNQFLSNHAEYGAGVLVHTSGATPLCTSYCSPDFSGPGGGGDSNLVDTAPASGYGAVDFNDAPLSLNESYADEAAGVSFQVTETSSGHAIVQVTIGTPRRTVRTVVYPASAGTVETNGSVFTPGQSVTLTAQPAACFVRWRENRANQSYPNPYTFTIQSDRLIEAVFSSATCAPAPANDQFPGAAVGAGQHTALNYGASTEGSEPLTFSCDGSNVSISKTAWYTYTPSLSSQVTLSTAGSNFDTILRVYSGNSIGSLTPLACDDDVVSNVNLASQVQFNAQAGTPYRIQIGGYHNSGNDSTASGNLILTIASTALEADPRQDGAIGVAGNLLSGGTATFTVSVKNHGGTPTPAIYPYIDGANPSGASWRTDTASPTSSVIQPGQTVTFMVTEPVGVAGVWTGNSVSLWNADSNSHWKSLPANGHSQLISFTVSINCSPRPKINLATNVTGDGRLAVTLSASGADAGNRLVLLRFDGDARTPNPNALIDLPGVGNGRTAPSTVQIPGSPPTYTFYLRRQSPGAPVTLPLTVTDGCGDWQTVVGGGIGAGF